MPLKDATLLLVRLEQDRPGSALLEALIAGGDGDLVQVLDVVIVSRRTVRLGHLTEIDVAEFALAGITLSMPGLIGVDDAAELTGCLGIGTSAAIVLSEYSPPLAAASAFLLQQERLIDVRHVPAAVANTVRESAQNAPIAPLPSIRRRCAVTPHVGRATRR